MKKYISLLIMTIIVINVHFADFIINPTDYTIFNPDEPQSELTELRKKKLIKTLIEEYQKNKNNQNIKDWYTLSKSKIAETQYVEEWGYPKEDFDSMTEFEAAVYQHLDYTGYPMDEYRRKRDYLRLQEWSNKSHFWYSTKIGLAGPDAMYPETEKFSKTLDEIINWKWDYYQETGKNLIFFPEEVFRISDYDDVDVEELEVKIKQLEEEAKLWSDEQKSHKAVSMDKAAIQVKVQ